LALGVYAGRSHDTYRATAWLLIFGLLVIGQYPGGKPKRPSRLMAYAFNWFLPALVLAGCVHRAVVRDYWGVAFFSIVLGFTLVNATYLEPSQKRTQLYRALVGVLGVTSAAAIWKSIWP
jgi:uncharacterized membrane protein YhaH (DUF805 family)